ncbi:hypothetical protein KAT36_02060 [Candidatus Pacearchaeota archaeon]|nr:hypothetical protein [Candidatus Pacearchaeota archaeon]
MVTINISKKNLHLWVFGFVVLLGIGFGVAYGGSQPSIHGHTIGEIEGLSGGGGDWTCVRVVSTKDSGATTVSCPSGHKLITGGCYFGSSSPVDGRVDNSPSDTVDNAWRCRNPFGGSVTAVAQCCDVSGAGGVVGGGSEAITNVLHYESLSVKPSDGSKQLYTRDGSGCIHSLKTLNYEQLGSTTYFSYLPAIRFIIDGKDSGYLNFNYQVFPIEEITFPKTDYIYQYVNIPETICYSESIEIWASVTQRQCGSCNKDMNLYFKMLWSEK